MVPWNPSNIFAAFLIISGTCTRVVQTNFRVKKIILKIQAGAELCQAHNKIGLAKIALPSKKLKLPSN